MHGPAFRSFDVRRTPEQQAAEYVSVERERQLQIEGWSAEHDDAHTDCSLLRVAVIYLHHGTELAAPITAAGVPLGWPWDARWWKPKSRRRNLVRAGALCLAERARCIRAGLPTNAADSKYAIAIRELAGLDAKPSAAEF